MSDALTKKIKQANMQGLLFGRYPYSLPERSRSVQGYPLHSRFANTVCDGGLCRSFLNWDERGCLT
jgi:hypothetical protein